MADSIKSAAQAATAFVPPRNVKVGRTSTPPGRQVESGQELSRTTEITFNQAVDTYLNLRRVTDAVRMGIRQMGTVGTAHFNLIETAHTDWSAIAYSDADGEIDEAGQQMLTGLLTRMNTTTDYSIGFDDKIGFERVIELMLNDVTVSGGTGLELVLDKSRYPDRLVPFPYDSITWVQGGNGRYPQQAADGEPVPLNLPTVWVSDFHRFVNEVYAFPMFEAALRDGRAYEQFLESMRRAVDRSGHSRLTITLDATKIKEVAPADVQADPELLMDWMEKIRADVEAIANDLKPDDAFVTYDTAKADLLSSKGEKDDYVSLMNALSGNLATSLKSNPSILGLRIEGSQSLSNTESLVFMKVASAVRRPVEECLSRALTLGCRLLGGMCNVKFRFKPIDLRPKNELAAFETMQMDRDLRLLSIGQITDLEFSIRQGLGTLPAGYKPLSGTGFYESKAVDASKASPNNGAQERALQPDTPSKAGGNSQ